MAERAFLFLAADGFHEEAATTDSITLGGLTMGGDIDLDNAGKVVNSQAASADGDLISYNQTGAQLSGLTVDSNNLALANGALITGLPAVPSTNDEAASKAYVDASITGLTWKDPVDVLRLMGNVTVATANGLSPSQGQAYVITDAGTLTAGSVAVVAGDLVEFDGTDWVKLKDGVGGFVADGVRAILSDVDTLVSPYTDGTDNDKIVDFDGTSLTGVDTGDADQGNAVLIQDENTQGVYNNLGYVYEGTPASGSWVQFTGAGQILAGLGLTKSGQTINVGNGDGILLAADSISVDITSNGGLTLTGTSPNKTVGVLADSTAGISVGAGGVAVSLEATPPGRQFSGGDLQAKVDTTAGLELTAAGIGIDLAATAPGLQFDGSGDLEALVNASAAMSKSASGLEVKLETGSPIIFGASDNGLDVQLETTNPTLDVVGGELGVKYSTTTGGLDQDTGGLKVKVDGTTITIDGSGQLVAQGADEASRIENNFTAGENLTAGDPVYFDATSDQVAQADAATDSKRWAVGVCRVTTGSSGSAPIVTQGVCTGVLSGATPGQRYYLASGSGLNAGVPSGAVNVVLVGYAINATDLFVMPAWLGKKRA
jgi:hypothetical protein